LEAMGQPVSRNMCCSVRDKNEKVGPLLGAGQFACVKVDLSLHQPRAAAFGPVWDNGGTVVRRLAICSDSVVQVYRFSEESTEQMVPQIILEYTLDLGSDKAVTAMIFTDELSSRHLAVAYGPAPDEEQQLLQTFSRVRVWSCGDDRRIPSEKFAQSPRREPTVWNEEKAFTGPMDEHAGAITRLAVSATYLICADSIGECSVWQKSRSFVRKAHAKLHNGPVADLAVDRLFVYSCGQHDRCLSIWAVPDLQPVFSVDVEIPGDLLVGLGEPYRHDIAAMPGCRLSSLTSLRRPLSRWAGSQGSNRSPNIPRGTVFIAGILAEGVQVAGTGAGVLMEWSLGPTPRCTCAVIAASSPIACMAYGPYDNGPLLTASVDGVFRIWDCVPRLTMSQQTHIVGCNPAMGFQSIVVEPQYSLYSIGGENKLLVWRRLDFSDIPDETETS